MKNKIELIKNMLILILLILNAIFIVKVTNKVNDLENRINKIKLLNQMFYEDMEQTYEYKQEQGIDTEIIIE